MKFGDRATASCRRRRGSGILEGPPGCEERLHVGRERAVKTRGFVGDESGFNMVGTDLGDDDQAAYLAATSVAPCGAEEDRNGFSTVHLEELADLGLSPNILVDGAKNGAHGSCLSVLPGDLTIDDGASAGRINGLELLWLRRNSTDSECES